MLSAVSSEMAPIYLITHTAGSRILKKKKKKVKIYILEILERPQDLAEKQQIGYSQNLG